jgi:hypothetical protein
VQNRRHGTLAATALVVLAASACAGTKWVNTWTEPGAAGRAPLKKILVIGMSADMANRKAFEDSMVASLKGYKVVATPSMQVLPEGQASEEALRAKVKEGGYDGVIITRLVSVDEQTDYVPPSGGVVAGGYGWGPYYGGYGGWYSTVYSPGYLVNTTIVRLQTRLWGTEGEGTPLWTGVSESVDPTDVKAVSNKISFMVTKELDQHGLI